MPTVAVAGGTGTLGGEVATALEARGADVRRLSRSSPTHPIDLATGAGLREALDGCDVVVDASNGPPSAKARTVLVDGGHRLSEAAKAVGVSHHVCASIVGIEDTPMAYYRVKLEQEGVVKGGVIPWTIVRATQFHELLDGLLSGAARWRVAPAASARLQPVAAAEVGSYVADVALGSPSGRTQTIAGPDVHTLRELAAIRGRVTGKSTLPVPVPLPGKLGRALRAGALTNATPDVRGQITYEAWLGRQA